tara:strand:- start:2472 stop:2984 length:513 start_codon:yes stop_codon:yes gene_type:complete
MNDLELLDLAYQSIKATLEKKEINTTPYETFKEKKGAFITIKKKNILRGCIGVITTNQPLYITIRDMAISAAFYDSRFRPLVKEEFKEIKISISILSIPKKIEEVQEIKIGLHGVILKKGAYQAVFLPEVAIEQQWNLKQFLEHLAVKARLNKEDWKQAELFIFSTKKLN